jgi:HEAT repeat protein
MSEFDFQPYLSAIDRHYGQWWQIYTLTDAVGRERQQQTPLFDFGLMVERREEGEKTEEGREKAEDGREEEKIERLPVLEGLRKYAVEHVLLVGRPGSGKSTALARLMLEVAADGSIPVLVELRSYQTSILDLIRNAFKRHGMNLSIAEIEILLNDRRLILLIDGVNELPSEAARSDLSNFRRNHPNVPMIFTTRDLGLGGDLGIEKKLEIQALTETQMQAFVRAYIPEKAEVMLRQLQGRLRELGQTPLLLWMLCSLFQQTDRIPQNLGEVFRSFTQGYERQLKQDVVTESDRRLWFDLLKQLAARMMQGTRPTELRVAIGVGEICQVFGDYLGTSDPLVPRQALDDLLKYHLIQRNGDLVEFRHQLIQEYYAAEWLLERVRGMDDETLECDYLNYLKWTEPVRLMLALVGDDALAVRVVERALWVDLMLGARLVGASPSKFLVDTTKILDSIKVPDCLTEEFTQQIQATNSLPDKLPGDYWKQLQERAKPELITDKKIQELCSIIVGQDHQARWKATDQLEKLFWPNKHLKKLVGDKANPLLLNSIHHPDPNVRHGVAHSFLLVGDRTVIQGLLKLLKDSSEDVRRSAGLALGRVSNECTIQDDDVIWELIELIHAPSGQFENISQLRSLIFSALANIGGEKVLAGLLNLAEHPDSEIRWLAIDALGEIQDKRAVPSLLARLRDCEERIRSKAVYTLSWLGDETIVPELIAYFQSIPSRGSIYYDERCSVVKTLGLIRSRDAIPLLRSIVEQLDKSLYLHTATVLALGEIGDEMIIPKLIEVVNSINYHDVEASNILARMNEKSAVVHIVECILNNGNYLSLTPNMELIKALSQFKDDTAAHALPKLLSYLQTDAGQVAYPAIQGIQANCKFYNYEIHQKALARSSPANQQRPSGSPTYQFPNATEVKIFEQIGNYHECPRDPPS